MKNIFNDKKIETRRGQSLMELLIGMAVGAVLIIGSAAIITSSLQENGQVTNIQIQAQLGEQLLNNTKAWAQGNWNALLALATSTTSSYYLNTASSPFTVFPAASSSISNYTYSRAITVTSTTSIASGTNTNFPMLFSNTYSWLEASSSGGRIQNLVTAPNGRQEPADLVFATSSANCGTSNLNFETESYTSSTGAITDWVSVPSLSAGTVIYACYGASSVTTDQSHPSNTWNSNYGAVYHFPSVSNFGLDSTVNGFNLGTSTASSTSGIINGAAAFNGTTQNMATNHAVSGAFPYAMQAWVKLSSATPSTEERYFTEDNAGIGEYSWVEYWNNSGYNIRMITCTSGCSTLYYDEFNIPTLDTNWHDIVAVFNSATSYSLYFDGQRATSRDNGGGGATMTDPTRISLGGLAGGAEFPGILDEARLTTNAPTPSWILSEYNNQDSPTTFYTVGNEQATGGGSGDTVVNNGVTYQSSFSVSDVYRDSNGNVTTTVSGNFDDPSTKLITATVSVVSSTISPTTYSMYLTRNSANYLDQATWAGGAGATVPETFVSSTYAAATNTATTTGGGLQISVIPSGGNNYSYSRAITVTSTTSVASGTNTNFPMLFSATYSWLEASSSGGRIQNLTTAPNGGQEPADLIFSTSTACSSPLNFETESYTSSTGAIADWINVPSLSAGTVIYACYGASSVTTDQSHPSSTWNSNYLSIWHLPSPTSTVSTFDSTAQGNNGTITGVGVTSTVGKIGGAANFNPVNTSFILGANTINIGQETVSMWVNLATYAPNYDPLELVGGFVQNNGGSTYDKDILINNTGQTEFYIYDGSQEYTPWGATIATGTWNYLVGTGNGSNISMYVNGVFTASTSAGNSYTGYSGPNILLGGRTSGYAQYLNGSADEFDVQNTAMTPSWILTEYNNQNSPSTFYGIGTEATSTGGGGGGGSATSTIDSQPFDTGSASGAELNSFIWQGSQPAGTTATFQFAVSNSSSGPWTFVGPDGTNNTYYSGTPGTPINLVSTTNGYTLFSGYRYFAYRTTLSTTGANNPVVNEVTVNWSP